jgi:hypothetical protein
MKWMRWMVTVFVLGLTVVGCGKSSPSNSSPASSQKIICPMDGAVRDTPGPCPKCGMDLPVKK